jgi:hypothetical protein
LPSSLPLATRIWGQPFPTLLSGNDRKLHLGQMALEQRKRLANLGSSRREYAVQPELVRSLADALARTVATEQRSIVEADSTERLVVA